MLNAGVQGAFQELADNYSHSLALPTEMGLSNKTFISYKVTNFIWSQHFVAFEATSTFKAEINGRNVTYIPNEGKKTKSFNPIGHQSNLLQGDPPTSIKSRQLIHHCFRSSTFWLFPERGNVVC